MPRWTVLVAVAATLLAGCGGTAPDQSGQARAEPTKSPSSPAASPSETARQTPAEDPADDTARGTVVKTAGSEFGTMLFDRRDQAIYLFDKERTSRPDCYGACAKAWPPVLTDGEPRARGQVRAGLLGTTERRDGATQVTYAGHPLYYYAHEGPNEVLCHDVDEFGGLWLVVRPDGKPAD